MRLYHFSRLRNVDDILDGGLVPRGTAKGRGWSGHLPSNPAMVYLGTRAMVRRTLADSIGSGAVFVVDVDERKLYPDEDWLEYDSRDPDVQDVMARYESGSLVGAWRPPRKVAWALQKEHKTLWRASLRERGSVAHLGAIPARRVELSETVINPEGEYR